MNKRINFLTLFCVCLLIFANQVAAKDTLDKCSLEKF